MKHMKAEYSDYHIQDAVTSVEILFQLGLLSKETFKLYYDRKDPGEENEVKDENGEALVIDIWSCVFLPYQPHEIKMQRKIKRSREL